jgi:hypothetical protein
LSDTALKKTFIRFHILSTAHRGSDTFKVVNECITSEEVSWSNCVGVCMDGAAAALTGHRKGFQTEVRQIAPYVNFIEA